MRDETQAPSHDRFVSLERALMVHCPRELSLDLRPPIKTFEWSIRRFVLREIVIPENYMSRQTIYCRIFGRFASLELTSWI